MLLIYLWISIANHTQHTKFKNKQNLCRLNTGNKIHLFALGSLGERTNKKKNENQTICMNVICLVFWFVICFFAVATVQIDASKNSFSLSCRL